jgi:hypothetical protein
VWGDFTLFLVPILIPLLKSLLLLYDLVCLPSIGLNASDDKALQSLDIYI